MPRTQITNTQIQDGTIVRTELNVSTPGAAVVRKLIAGVGVSFTSTGADAGTGDVTIGSSGVPAGADTQLQFNDAGVFGIDADLAWDKTTNTLNLLGVNTGIVLQAITAEPAAASANTLRAYCKNVAGQLLLKWIGPSGTGRSVQASLAENQVSLISPGAATTPGVIGCVIANVGTISHPTPTSTDLKTQTRRFVNTSSATAGTLASTRISVLECHLGAVAGLGGFHILARFSLDVLAAGMRAFVGLTDTASAAPINIDPTTSTTPGKIGLAINASTGNWNLVHNATGAAPTVIALGANFPVNITDSLELQLFAAPNSASVNYRVMNWTTNLSVTGTISTNLPANTVFMGRTIWATNNATAAAVAWSMSRFYLGTDY